MPDFPDEPRLIEPAFDYPWRSVTRWLVILNIAVFVLDYFVIRKPVTLVNTDTGQPILTEPLLAFWGHFSVALALGQHQFWRFFTYQFVHANLEHVAVNMMGLFVIGPLVEDAMGRWRYLLFYLLCGAAGPIAHIGLSQLGFVQLNYFTPLVGASASIYGVFVAAALIAPDEPIIIAFLPRDVKLKYVVVFLIALSFAAVLWNWQNAGGHAAHIGGAIAGWLLAKKMAKPQPSV